MGLSTNIPVREAGNTAASTANARLEAKSKQCARTADPESAFELGTFGMGALTNDHSNEMALNTVKKDAVPFKDPASQAGKQVDYFLEG